MLLDDYLAEWKKESGYDQTDLSGEALKIPLLHAKWLRYLSNERLILKKLESDAKRLKHDKYEFYTMGPNEDTPKNWKLPPKGMILKSEAMNYVDSDKDIIELNLKVAYQQEKVDILAEILKMIHNRQWHIRSAIDWNKFQAGG
jgi:hypothetical protein